MNGIPQPLPATKNAAPSAASTSPIARRPAESPTDCGPERAAREPLILHRIGDRGVGLTLWERELPEALPDAVAAWGRGRPEPFDGVLEGPAFDVGPWLTDMPPDLRAWMERDLRDLATRLALAGSASRLRFFFGPVRDDRCRRFHHDYVQLRLVCTYAGPGTEWVSEAHVNREAMQREWCCVDDANRAIVAPEHVRHASVGDVLVFKGAHHRTSAGRGAVHRSPPLDGATRVVLIASVL